MHFLDHQFGQIVEHIGKRVGLRAAPGRHIGQDRLFAGIEFDDLGHEAVDRLVIGDARARRVGDGDPAGAIDVHDPGNAEHALRIERQGIEIIVIDPAIDHVDRLPALGRAHGHAPAFDFEIAAFDQLGAHLVGQESMLEIGRIVNARREHRHRRLVPGKGRRGTGGQTARQPPGIVRYLAHAHLSKQLGKHRHHRLAVLQHVGDPRRRARVVFQNHEIVFAGTDEIDPDDMGIDPARRREPGHLRKIGGIVAQQPFGHAPGADDFLTMVKVVQKGVERAHPLLDPARQLAPLARGDDPRHRVKRDQPFFGVGGAIDVERDPGSPKKSLCLDTLALQQAGRLCIEPLAIPGISRAHRAIGFKHLVIRRGRGSVHRLIPYARPLCTPLLAQVCPPGKPARCNCEIIGSFHLCMT